MRGSTFTKFVFSFVFVVGLSFLLARPAAAQTGVVWGMSINQEDIKPNPPFAPSIHFVHNGERVGSWDASRSRDVCAPIGDVWEFQPNPVGLNPKDITRMAISFNWRDWVDGTREENGWVVRVNSADKKIISIAGIEYTPVMAVEGKIGEKVVRFIFTFRWKTNEQVFSILKIMAWETPEGYATMSRKRAFLRYEGVKQAWSAVSSQEADAQLAAHEASLVTTAAQPASPQPAALPAVSVSEPQQRALARAQAVLGRYPQQAGRGKIIFVIADCAGNSVSTYGGKPGIVDIYYQNTVWRSYTLASSQPGEAGVVSFDVDPGTVLIARVRGDRVAYPSSPAASTGPTYTLITIKEGR